MSYGIYKLKTGEYGIFGKIEPLGAQPLQQGIADAPKAIAILDALDAKQRPASGVSLSYTMDREFDRIAPSTKLQHRKIFKDDEIVSSHAKWHDLGALVDGVECSQDESTARAVIANGGVEERGYCLNMFRLVTS